MSATRMDLSQITALKQSVQHNCHISDARFGTEYGLCTYLMKMREYFRWEHELGFSDPLDKDEVGNWLSERELVWEGLAEADFSPIRIRGVEFQPFENVAINEALEEAQLVYSSGIGHSGKPHFFLAELEQLDRRDEYSLVVTGRELARDLTAPPAMTRDDVIFVRRESLRRMLWEKLESWRWNRPDNALGRAFACFDFEQDLEGSLDEMTQSELELVRLHEQGEHRAGLWLEESWNRMLLDLTHTPAELAARAVRDHLADSMVTLPALANLQVRSSMHFFIGNLSAMRRALFPGLQEAYAKWLADFDVEPLRFLAIKGVEHWKRVAKEMLDLHSRYGSNSADLIYQSAKTSTL